MSLQGNKRWEEFSWNEESSFWADYVVWHAQGVDRVMLEEYLRNSSDWWIIIFWQASHFSSTACQTLYMGSGLPTRKSVLNHSMTSTFSFLCTSRTNCSISSLFAADWGDAVEQNYVAILSWHSLSGERIINQIKPLTYRFSSQVSFVWPESHVHSLAATHQHFHFWVICFSSEAKSMHFFFNLDVLEIWVCFAVPGTQCMNEWRPYSFESISTFTCGTWTFLETYL